MNEAQNDAALIPAQAADHEDRRVLRLVLFDALASEAMGTLTYFWLVLRWRLAPTTLL